MRRYAGCSFVAASLRALRFAAMSLRIGWLESQRIVTNYLQGRTSSSREKKKRPDVVGALARFYVGLRLLGFCGSRTRVRRGRSCPAHFAYFEAREAADGNVFAEFGDRLRDHLSDGHALVFDVMLFVKAVFLVKLFHLARDDSL